MLADASLERVITGRAQVSDEQAFVGAVIAVFGYASDPFHFSTPDLCKEEPQNGQCEAIKVFGLPRFAGSSFAVLTINRTSQSLNT